jgi:hypothetical protein
MLRPILIALALAPLAFGQPTAGGTSSIVSRIDPLNSPPPVETPPGWALRGQPVIGWQEYLKRKANLPTRNRNLAIQPAVDVVDRTGVQTPRTPVRQPLTLTPTQSFEGIAQTNMAPPDPDVAVGPEDVVQVVNSAIARYSKTGQQTSQMPLQQWFSTLLTTICPSGSASCPIVDPSIRYDQLHGRFVMVAFSTDVFTGKTYFLVSASNGATYASGFKNFALDGSLNGMMVTNLELDFPQFGYDNNAVYLTANMYTRLNTLQYAKIRILKKSELYNPATVTLTYQDIWDLQNEDGTKATSLRPAILRGQPGTGTPPGILVNASDSQSATYLTLWRVNNPLTATPSAVRATLTGVWTYSYPAFFPQQGTTLLLDPGDTRILKAVLRNGALYTARNSGYSIEPTTVTYDRIDLGSNKVSLQARLLNGNYFFPALDITASLGPGNVLPNKLFAGSTTSATGTLTYAGFPEVKLGEDPYEGNTRWGDYFGAAVDPVQGGEWVYGQYAKTRGVAAGRWATWTAYFPWATSAQFTDVPSTSWAYDFANVMRLWSITSGCTATAYCPMSLTTRGQAAVFIIRAMLGEGFTFPEPPYFTDVPATHPYFKYIQKLRELGITAGCTATTYCPDQVMTREQMAVFLVSGKLSNLFGDAFTFPATAYFTDVPDTHAYFKYIQKLRELGITGGCAATTYCPDQVVTREQMAVFVVRAFLN